MIVGKRDILYIALGEDGISKEEDLHLHGFDF